MRLQSAAIVIPNPTLVSFFLSGKGKRPNFDLLKKKKSQNRIRAGMEVFVCALPHSRTIGPVFAYLNMTCAEPG